MVGCQVLLRSKKSRRLFAGLLSLRLRDILPLVSPGTFVLGVLGFLVLSVLSSTISTIGRSATISTTYSTRRVCWFLFQRRMNKEVLYYGIIQS